MRNSEKTGLSDIQLQTGDRNVKGGEFNRSLIGLILALRFNIGDADSGQG